MAPVPILPMKRRVSREISPAIPCASSTIPIISLDEGAVAAWLDPAAAALDGGGRLVVVHATAECDAAGPGLGNGASSCRRWALPDPVIPADKVPYPIQSVSVGSKKVLRKFSLGNQYTAAQV